MRVLSMVMMTAGAAMAACGSTSDAGMRSDAGAAPAAVDAAPEAAPPAPAPAKKVPACTDSFGAPATLAMAPDGSDVVLEGMLLRAPNIVVAEPKGSTCTDASRAVELITTGDAKALEPVLVANAGTGVDVACGCADTEDAAVCARLAFGPKLRLRGKLTRTTSQGPCNQDPCLSLAFDDVCAVMP